MIAIKFKYRDDFWLIHLQKLPKVGEEINIVRRGCLPLGCFWVSWREQHNGYYIGHFMRLGEPKGSMCIVAELTSPPESH